jgi:hypothetical protein
MLGES